MINSYATKLPDLSAKA